MSNLSEGVITEIVIIWFIYMLITGDFSGNYSIEITGSILIWYDDHMPN